MDSKNSNTITWIIESQNERNVVDTHLLNLTLSYLAKKKKLKLDNGPFIMDQSLSHLAGKLWEKTNRKVGP